MHASGYEVALYNNPEPIIRIVGTGPWDLDALAGQVERSFGPVLGTTLLTGRPWQALAIPCLGYDVQQAWFA